MIIRQATRTDEAKWDEYVNTHPYATPYHRFAWGVACEEAYGQTMHYWLAEDSDNKIIGLLPAINFKKLTGGRKVTALPYCDVGFILADSADISTALLSKLPSGSDYRDMRQVPAETDSLSIGQKVVLRLPLPDSSENLMASFKSKLRSQIRKATKNGLTVSVSEENTSHQKLVTDFYQIYARNMRQLASPSHALSWFKSVLQAYDDKARVCVVYNDEQAIGAGLVLLNGSVAAIPWASTLSQFNRLAPNMLLYWSLLENVTDAGMSVFDFGRSSFGEGTYKFKTQWGAVPHVLHWHDGSAQDVAEAVETGPPGTIRQIAESVWPKLPLGLTISVGSAIRRYISL